MSATARLGSFSFVDGGRIALQRCWIQNQELSRGDNKSVQKSYDLLTVHFTVDDVRRMPCTFSCLARLARDEYKTATNCNTSLQTFLCTVQTNRRTHPENDAIPPYYLGCS